MSFSFRFHPHSLTSGISCHLWSDCPQIILGETYGFSIIYRLNYLPSWMKKMSVRVSRMRYQSPSISAMFDRILHFLGAFGHMKQRRKLHRRLKRIMTKKWNWLTILQNHNSLLDNEHMLEILTSWFKRTATLFYDPTIEKLLHCHIIQLSNITLNEMSYPPCSIALLEWWTNASLVGGIHSISRPFEVNSALRHSFTVCRELDLSYSRTT